MTKIKPLPSLLFARVSVNFRNSARTDLLACEPLMVEGMETFYVACDLGREQGRMSLGTLDNGRLHISEIRSFVNTPTHDRGGDQWNVGTLYQQMLEGLGDVASVDEPVETISCTSWANDYMLFDTQGALLKSACGPSEWGPPPSDSATLGGLPLETVYEETGTQPVASSTLCRLGAEEPRQLSKVGQILPVANGFNYLLSGAAMVDASMASSTQIFNPFQGTWSRRLLEAAGLPSTILPPIVPSGTVLGLLRRDIAEHTRLEDVQVVASCSHDLASAITSLPTPLGSEWVYLKLDADSLMGTEVDAPIVNRHARELKFTNESGFGGTTYLSKVTAGLWIADQCHRFWAEQEQGFDWNVLMHLAASSTPFESLINPLDARFASPGEMPLKIRGFCKDTNQTVPRKPGPTMRCVLESVALYLRRTLLETERISGKAFDRVYLMGRETDNPLLQHFLANALRLPVIIVPENPTAIGNVVVQALAKGHINSLEAAREIVADSFPFETIVPHASAWNSAYQRLDGLI